MFENKKLLSQCAKLINKYGPDSDQVIGFIGEQKQKGNNEVVQLCELSRSLKRVLTTESPLKPAGSKGGK